MALLLWTFAGMLAGLLSHRLLPLEPLSERDCLYTGAAAGLVGGGLLAPVLGLTDFGEPAMAGLVTALISTIVALSILAVHREEA